MTNTELLEQLKQDFKQLRFKDKYTLDRLSRRLKMLLSNIYGETSHNLRDFQTISFSPSIYYSGMPESISIEAWEAGKNKTVNLIDTIIEESELFPVNSIKSSPNRIHFERDCSKVFIVHGHDSGAKETVARFVDKLGFEAIILHEQENSGATIIEKLEKHTDVGFAIVLYTACDVGNVKTETNNLKPRARQNVVFEHGLLIGKIGRENVVALVKDDVEIPNDLSGIVYETMDSSGAWKLKLAKEMRASGYDIDMNKVL